MDRARQWVSASGGVPRGVLVALLGLAALMAPARGAAQAGSAASAPSVMVVGEASFLTPVAAPTFDRFYPGGLLSVAALFAPYPFLLPVIRGRAALLGDGPPPQDPRVADPGVGGLYSLSAGVRLRPEGFAQRGARPCSTGFWLEIDVGAALTGTLARPVFEVAMGYHFDLGTFADAGQIDLGPTLRFVHVLQTEDTGLDGSSAYFVALGAEAVFLDAAPRPEELAALRAAEERAEREQMDSDADGIDDADDACPYIAEDPDGFQDEDGCPDTDDDRDGIPDTRDACPREPEDADGYRDEDGCPDPDNDGDEILDGVDQCPNDAETVNGNADADGCPDEGLIQLIDDRIVLEERVLFALNRSRIRHEARPILEAVANLLQQHPEWVQLRVEGHADQQGEEDWNVELSRRRAARVREALEALGVAGSRLVSEGYGSSRPRVEGSSEEAFQANRRVEIVVSERAARAGAP